MACGGHLASGPFHLFSSGQTTRASIEIHEPNIQSNVNERANALW
jgi:hypothetical protein